MFRYLQKYKEKLPDMQDILMIIGIILAGKGIYLIYKPAALIAVGLFLIFLGWPKGRVM